MSVLTYKETQKIRRNVRRTAKLLDKKYTKITGGDTPWYRKISLSEFKFNDCRACVLGQLFGTCEQGVRTLGVNGEDSFYANGVGNSDYSTDSYNNGDTALSDAELEQMTILWFEEILDRRRTVAQGV